MPILNAAIRSGFPAPALSFRRHTAATFSLSATRNACASLVVDAPIARPYGEHQMYGFGTNFLAGLVIGGALAAVAPLAATDLAAGGVRQDAVQAQAQAQAQAQVEVQTVNRSAKSDRLHNPQRATRGDDESKPVKIPVGCDAAFSPLSKGAAMNFASRCLAENDLSGEPGIVTVVVAAL